MDENQNDRAEPKEGPPEDAIASDEQRAQEVEQDVARALEADTEATRASAPPSPPADFRRIFRSRRDRLFVGVCGGLSNYFQIDSLWVRLSFILLTLASGFGILLYLVLAVLLPREDGLPGANPEQTALSGVREIGQRTREVAGSVKDTFRRPAPCCPAPTPAPPAEPVNRVRHGGFRFFLGALLFSVGVLCLLENLNILEPWWLHTATLWPCLLIAFGIWIVLRRLRSGAKPPDERERDPRSQGGP